MAKPPLSHSDPSLRAVFDLAEHLTSGRRLPDDSRELLREALNSCIASGFETSLFSAIGVRRWGGVSALKQVGLSRRDRALCRLRRRVAEWRELPPSAAAKAMSASLLRYETTRWRREREAITGPSSDPNSTWWSMLRAGTVIPGEKRLAQILAAEIQDGFEFPSPSAKRDAKGDTDGEATPH